MRDADNTYGFSKDDAGELVQLIGGADREYLEGKVRGNGGGASIYLFTLTATITSGSGTGTIRNLSDDTEIATGQTIEDPLGHFTGLTSGYRGYCVKNGANYVALSPYVTDVDWTDPNLRYYRDDGTTAIPIDTAEDCGGVNGGTF
ncbi:MAG: hypothetical protein KDB22_26590 [Planctomycetales bacterium]|nr:hypothetical protein [Planctomycetales bacterium]